MLTRTAASHCLFPQCRYDKTKVIVGSDNGAFTNMTGAAPSEEQLAAFLHHNGPVQTGINANVFGMREKGWCVALQPMCLFV